MKMVWLFRLYIVLMFSVCRISSSGHAISDSKDDFLQEPSQIYGYSLPEKTKTLGNATVEHVVVLPQESYGAQAKIARHGVLMRNKNAKSTILICHGFMCDKYDAGMLRKVFKKSDCNVMTFDFRGHGDENQGQYCTFGKDEALDVIAAAKFLRAHPELKDKPLFVYGFSMGAVSAIEAQALKPGLFDAMILDCPFESSAKVIETGLDGLKFSICGYQFEFPGKILLQRYAFHPYVQSLVKVVLRLVSQMDATEMRTNFCPVYPVESIKKVTVPCFFIHCKNDEKVSVDQIKAVYQGACGYKRLWITNGRRHCDSVIYNPEKYTYRVRQFLRHVLNDDLLQYPGEGIVEDENNENEYLFER